MNKAFENVCLKVEWSNKKVREVQACISSVWSKPNACTAFCDVDPQTGHRSLKLRLVDSLPSDLFMLTAEHIYHARSALDNLAIALARIHGSTSDKGIYFPFAGDADEFVKPTTQRKIQKLAPEDIAIIAAMKPYKGGDDNLWALSKLSNIDKHIDFIPVASIARGTSISNATFIVDGGDLVIGAGPVFESLHDGVTLTSVGTVGSIEFNEKTQVNLTPDVIFGNVEIFAGKSVVPSLLQLTQLVEGIIQRFMTRYP